MALQNIEGNELDGSCTNLTIGTTIIPFISFSYSDNVETEWIYRSGSQMPDAETPGQYKPGDGKLKISGRNARALLLPALPKIGAANAKFVCVVNFIHPAMGSDSDALYGCSIKGNSASLEASAKGQECEFTVKYKYIAWTSKRIIFGNRRGPGAVGASKL